MRTRIFTAGALIAALAGCGFRGQSLEVSPEDRAGIDVTGAQLAPLRFVGFVTPRLGAGVGQHVPRSPEQSNWVREWTFQFRRDVELRMDDTANLLLELAGYSLDQDEASEGVYALGGEVIYYDVETREGYSRDSVAVGLGIRWDLISPANETVLSRDTWTERREAIFSDAYGNILNLTNRIFLLEMIELLRDEEFRLALQPATTAGVH